MLETLETGIGLDFILWLQENRTGWMELLVQILNQIGLEFGYIALFGFIFWIVNKRHGIRLVFALILIAIVSFSLKDLLARPRPYMVSDLVQPVFEAEGFGLPSGHVSFAIMIWGYIALWLRKGWVWAIAILYMILQGFGRMLAGVHYPQDVLFGAFVGILTLVLFYPAARRWGVFWRNQSLSTQIRISVIIPLLFAIFAIVLPLEAFQVEAYLTMLGLMMGVGIGAAIESRFVQFEPHDQLARKLIHFILSALLLVVILLGLGTLFDLIAETGILAYALRIVRYALVGFSAIAIVPWLGIQLNLMQTEPESTEPAQATV